MPHKFRCSVHVHFRNVFKDTQSLEKFTIEFRKYVEAEAKKTSSMKFSFQENLFILSTRTNAISFGFAKDFMDLMVTGLDRADEIQNLDDYLNRIYSFLGLSMPSIRLLGVSYSKEFPIDKNPIGKYVEKTGLADFNAKSKLLLRPYGLVLGNMGKDKTLLIVLEYDEDDETTELDITELWKDLKHQPLDILRKSNDSIDAQKRKIFAGLGVRAK